MTLIFQVKRSKKRLRVEYGFRWAAADGIHLKEQFTVAEKAVCSMVNAPAQPG